MSVDLPPLPRAHAAVPEGVTRERARGEHWPRLLAYLAGDVLEVAIERSDRSLSQRRRLALRTPNGLAETLKAWLATTGHAPVAAAIVVDGPVGGGRFQPRVHPRGVAIEALRADLRVHTLRAIDERAALGLATRALAADEARWVLAPRVAGSRDAVSTAVCRLASDTDAALLAPVGRAAPAVLLALMSHPFAPVHEDEQAVVAAMRARGVAPVFGNLLGTDGIARAFEALAGIDYDNACPLPADSVVSLAARDERARRACAVVCAAIAQLCALLSFDGVRRVLLAGRCAALLAPALAQAPLAERMRAVRAGAAEPPVDIALGVLPAPVRFLDGARATLEQAMHGLRDGTGGTLVERVARRRPQMTPQNQRVADLVVDAPAFVTAEPIAAIAAAAGVSPSQVSRFCRALGFGGLIEFKLALVASLARGP